MPDDSQKIAALADTFRAKLGESPATLTVSTLKTYRDTALAAMLANTTIISLSNEGGSTGAQITCEPAVALAACNVVLAEQGTGAVPSTGVSHLNLGFCRVET
jgi:hypothetical protein